MGTLRDDAIHLFVCLSVCSFVCRLWNLLSHSLGGTTWRREIFCWLTRPTTVVWRRLLLCCRMSFPSFHAAITAFSAIFMAVSSLSLSLRGSVTLYLCSVIWVSVSGTDDFKIAWKGRKPILQTKQCKLVIVTIESNTRSIKRCPNPDF